MSVRLDKWLWAARFFKTRAKAKEAIDGGKVHLNGSRTKPSKEVSVDDRVKITLGYDEKVVLVKNLFGLATPETVLFREQDFDFSD